MIFSLLIYTCALSGQDCRPVQINAERMSLGACMMASQIEAANYMKDHPKRVFVGSKCTDRPQKYLRDREA